MVKQFFIVLSVVLRPPTRSRPAFDFVPHFPQSVGGTMHKMTDIPDRQLRPIALGGEQENYVTQR